MKLSIDTTHLYQALNAAYIHASKDTTRPHLNSVCIDITSDNCHIVSTDGHRLSVYELPSMTDEAETGVFTLDAQGIKELLPLLKKEIKFGGDTDINIEDKAVFSLTGGTYFVRLLDEQFPPWRKVMPDVDSYTNPVTCFGINALYLADLPKAFGIKKSSSSPVLAIKSDDGLKPIQITSTGLPELTIVIMPMRI